MVSSWSVLCEGALAWTFHLGVPLPLTSCAVREDEGGGAWADAAIPCGCWAVK